MKTIDSHLFSVGGVVARLVVNFNNLPIGRGFRVKNVYMTDPYIATDGECSGGMSPQGFWIKLINAGGSDIVTIRVPTTLKRWYKKLYDYKDEVYTKTYLDYVEKNKGKEERNREEKRIKDSQIARENEDDR